MEAFGKVVFTLLFAVLNIFLGAYTFLTLWAWFIVTTFSEYAVEPLTWIQAYGVVLVISFLKVKGTDITDEQIKRTFGDEVTRVITVTVMYLGFLLFGWAAFQFMPV